MEPAIFDMNSFIPLPKDYEEALLGLVQAQLFSRPELVTSSLEGFLEDDSPANFVGFLAMMQGLNLCALEQVAGDRDLSEAEREGLVSATAMQMRSWYPVHDNIEDGFRDQLDFHMGNSDGLHLVRSLGPVEACICLAAMLGTLIDLPVCEDSSKPECLVLVSDRSNWRDVSDWKDRLDVLLFMMGIELI